MTAEILSVGTELLLGNILNTNAQFLSEELAKLGINVYYQTVVGDNAPRLLKAYAAAFSRADVVIATGGLGPTEDDLTKEVAAHYFGMDLALDESSLARLKAHFGLMHSVITENNYKQAYFPVGSAILENANGTAPGCLIEKHGKMLFMLPGPPNECVPMFWEQVYPILWRKSDTVLVSRTLKMVGVGESLMETEVKDLIDAQTNPTIAPYAKTGESWLRLTASAENENDARALLVPLADEIHKRFGDSIYGEDDDTLVSAVIKLIRQQGLTIALAESCTGGLLTSRFVDNPGVSDILLEGAVTYANTAKISRLGVRPETLMVHGAVSAETAAEMATGVAQTSGADIGVSTTGVAGPDGGTAEKPVGLVYVGLSVCGAVSAHELNLTGNREKIRQRAVISALDLLRHALLRALLHS